MKPKYIYIALLFVSIQSFSQSKKLDSLYKSLKKNPSQTATLIQIARELRYSNIDSVATIARHILQSKEKDFYCQAYTLLGNYYHAIGKTDSARNNYTASLKTPTTHKPEVERIATLLNLSNLMYFEGNTQNAIDTLNMIIGDLPKLKDAERVKQFQRMAKSMLADFYKEIGVEDLSIKYYYESISLAHAENDLNDESASWIGLGKLYFNVKDYSKSIECYKKAVSITESTNNLLYRANAFDVIGYNFLELNRSDSALVYQKMAEAILTQKESASDLLSNKILKGQIAQKKNEFINALSHFKEALQIANVNQFEPDKYITYENIGDAFMGLNKFDSAITYYSKAEGYYLQSNYTEELKNTRYKLLQCNLKANKDFTSIALLSAFDSAQNKYISDKKIQVIKAQEIKYETSLKEAQLAKQQAEIRVTKQKNNWLLGGAVVFGIVSIVLAGLYRVIRKKNKIIAGQKAEILHFHDNSLTQLRSMFKRQSELQLLGENVKTNEERVKVLSILHELLHGEGNVSGDLKEYLEKICDIKSKETDTDIVCDIPYAIQLKPSFLKDIGIITNEVLTNAVKYAFNNTAPKLITLKAVQKNSDILLHISDNGQGLPANFDPQKTTGFGMGYVADLVEQHDGEIKFYNKEGANFEVKLAI